MAGAPKLNGPMVVLLTVAAVGIYGAVTWTSIRSAEITPAIRGEQVARKLGCFACHGPAGTGGVTTVGDTGGTVPGWDHHTTAMYIRSEQELREWILYGAPLPQEEDPSAEPYVYDGLIPMPAYEGQLSGRELDNLVAYYLAVSAWAPDMPDDAYEGWRAASQLGCFSCHGPSGMGGMANPGSLTGRIPPWDGEGYAKLVKDDDELREWILDGRVERLWKDWLARYFLEGQTTQMPAYRGHVAERQIEMMVAYIQWLRQE